MTADPVSMYVTAAPSTNYLSLPAPNESPQPASTFIEREAFLQVDLTAYASLRRRLSELQELDAGWLDGGGERPQSQVLQCARVTLGRLLRLGTPPPRVYPTPEGGVQAEWTIVAREISLTFESDGTVCASAVDVQSGTEDELQDGNAHQIAQFILRIQ